MSAARFVDLHIHTTASDGTFSPTEAVAHARALGLSAIGITDHDTHLGLAEAAAAGTQYGVEVVPGIEVSVDYKGLGVHLLGYFIDPSSPALQTLLGWVVDERRRRNRLVIEAMAADGIPISIEWMERHYPGAVLGRPHFAAALTEFGLADSVQDGFDRFLNAGRPYYRPRSYIPLQTAFDVILTAGGKPVIAHPLQYRISEDERLTMIRTLRDAGAVGMECLYGTYDAGQVARLRELAARFDLCVTGGSDFHGSRKKIEMGTPDVPYALLEQLRAR